MRRPEGPIKVWKMVHLNDAERVARGSVKLGTFASYADLENGREDPMEGRVIVDDINIYGGQQPGARAVLDKMGFGGVPEGMMWMTDVQFEQRMKPLWIYCTSEVGCRYDKEPEKPKAIFEISDLRAFSELVRRRARSQVMVGMAGPVRYAPRRLQGAQSVVAANPDPFVKDPSFCLEREIRVCYVPQPGVQITEPIFLDEDEETASLLTLVA